MINATNKYKEYVSKKSRTFIPRLVIENQEYKRILNFEYEDGLESSDEMSLGSTISKSLKFSISAVEGTFNNKQVTVYIGLKTNTGIEEIKKATLTVVKATRKDGLLNFECYDQFYFCEKVFVTDLTGTQKVKTIVDEQCKKLGITFNGTIEDTSYNVDLLKGLTIREALSYLSAWCGKNAHFNNDGQLEFIGYNSVYEITASKYSSLDLAELDTTINSLNCITKESVTDEDGNTSQENKELTCGEGYGISFSCLGMTQERLNVIYKRLKGFKYRFATVSLSLSDPVIEPGDIIKLGDYFIPVMNITSSCDGGFQSEITAYAKTEQEQEFKFKGSLASQVERNYQEEASFRKLITENIKAFKGQFDEIDVDVININKELSAQEANIKKLDTEKLSAQEATIKYAQITDLKAVSGKFNTLESDYGKFKDLTSTNITGINANIKKINADNVNIANRVTANEGLIKNLDTVKLNAADAYLAFAKISDLNVTNANVTNLNVDLAKINTLLSGSVTAGSTETIVLNAKNTTIENALIKDAMIDSLSFNKISGVDINTTKITVHSDDGKSTWKDNTIKIADTKRTRVQIGKDSEGDYNIYIWDKSGNLMFDPLGLTDKGVTREVIDNSNVKENASIAGSKLDIDSVITEINGSITTIKSSSIKFDENNQTLDVAFKSMQTSISNQTETISTIEKKVETNTTDISTANGKISTLITNVSQAQKDITTAKTNITTLTNNYSTLNQTVSSLNSTIGSHTSSITTIQNGLKETTNKIDNLQVGGRNLYYLKDFSKYNRSRISSYSINDGEISLVSSGTDMYIGEVISASGKAWDSTHGPLMYVEGAKYVTLNISNSLFNKNCYNFYDKNKNSLATFSNFGSNKKTIVVPSNAVYMSVRIGYQNSTSGTTYKLKVKVEIGNKATDWTPAIEDTQTQITTISDKQSTFEQTLSGLKTQVSSLDSTVKTKADSSTVSSLSTTVNTLKSDLSGFKTTVSNTYTTKADFNNLQVGGRNILTYSGNFTTLEALNGYWNDNGGGIAIDTSVKYLGQNTLKTTLKSGIVGVFYELDMTKTYTYSAMIISNKAFNTGNVISPLHFHCCTEKTFTSSNAKGVDVIGCKQTIDEANKWTRLYLTFKPNAKYFRPFVYSNSTGADSVVFNIAYLKLEEGNHASDWTPAPEDVDSNIATVDSKFKSYSTTTQMNSAIETSKSSILSSVSNTYATKTQLNTANGNITSLTTRMQSAEQKLTKDGITSIVSDYYATKTEFDNLQVGGRNLILNSNSFDTNYDPTTTYKGLRVYKLRYDGTQGEYDDTLSLKKLHFSSQYVFQNGNEVTLSFYAKADKDGLRTQQFWYPNVYGVKNVSDSRVVVPVTTEWKRYEVHWKMGSGKDSTNFTPSMVIGRLQKGISDYGTLYICGVKFEVGNKSTPYTVAPEDTNANISSVSTVANQTATKISWLVKSGSSATDFTLTDRTATLVANAINLNGLVTFNGLNSDTQTKIINATTTANTASSNASSALSKANALETKANNGEFDGASTIIANVKTSYDQTKINGFATYGHSENWNLSSAVTAKANDIVHLCILNTTKNAYCFIVGKITKVNSPTYLTVTSYGLLDKGEVGAKGSTGATGLKALQPTRNWNGTFTTIAQTTTANTSDFNRTPIVGDTFTNIDGSSNVGTWQVTAISGTSITIKLLSYVNSKGATGGKGATGKGVSKIVTQYYLSTSNTSQAGGSWSETIPTWSSGKYYWTRDYITWSDSTTTYTTAVLDNALTSANSNATSAKSTADSVNKIVTNNKANWDLGKTAYDWTNANGTNMTNLRSMILKWTGNAVSASTQINGGWIKTNTITANKLAIGDFTNLITIVPSTPETFKNIPLCTLTQTTDNLGNYCVMGAASDNFLMFCDYTPFQFSVGDELYFTGTVANWGQTDIGVNLYVWLYDANKAYIGSYAGQQWTLKKTAWNNCSGSVKIGTLPSKKPYYYLVGIAKNNQTTVSIGLSSNAFCGRKYSGQLIVDGSITATKIANLAGFVIDDTYIQSTDKTVGLGTDANWAFWAGGATSDTAKFRVTRAGKVYLKDLEATGGKIGGFTLSNTNFSKTFTSTATYTQTDANNIMNYILGKTTLSDDEQYRLDINANGRLDAADYLMIKDLFIGSSTVSTSVQIGGNDYKNIFSISSTIKSCVDNTKSYTYTTKIGAYGIRTGGILTKSVACPPSQSTLNIEADSAAFSGSIKTRSESYFVKTGGTYSDPAPGYNCAIKCTGSIAINDNEGYYIGTNHLKITADSGDSYRVRISSNRGNSGGGIHLCCDYGVNVVNWDNNAFTLIRASAFNVSSLLEYKTNIKPLKNPFDIVQAGDIYTYNLKQDIKNGMATDCYGFIIGEGYRVPSNVLSYDKKTIDQYAMSGILWGATKELIKRSYSHDDKIRELETENNKLKQQIATLEGKLDAFINGDFSIKDLTN